VDIEEESLNIDPVEVEKALARNDRKVSCLLPVHLGGLPCNMEAITDLAEKYGIPVVEDCAHAFPAHRGGKAAGTWGDAAVFSFYATKTITTGEGGMLVTPRADIARTVENLRLHGIDRPVWDRFQSRRRGAWEYDVTAPGYKYNLPDLAAAIGRVQLGRADEFLKARKEMADFYRDQLKNIPGITLPSDHDGHAWHLFIIQLGPDFPLDRDSFMIHMAEEGVGTSVHYKPLHLMSYYADAYGLKPGDFPRAYDVFTRCVSLPLYPGMGSEALNRVVEAVKKAAVSPRTARGRV
jgi:dTDP-4-amino-4,6-dideoxygalactose transaminase